MTKQYRLKITWSNGDSEYVGGNATKDRMQALVNSLRARESYEVSDILYVSELIRRYQIEEVPQERSEKF